MKTLFILSACLIIATNDYVSESDIEREWKSFKDTYNKHYADNATEEIRKQIFINNTQMIKEHNAKFETGNVTFNMGMNQFGDMNHEEFLKRFSYREVNETHFRYNYSNNVSIDGPDNKEVRSRRSLPTEFRWEIPEEVIPVRDQGDCRSGWAYSAADTIASRCFLHKDCKKTIGSLSVQYLINCTSNLGNHRCQGGEAANACDLVRLNKKMPDEKSYNRQCSMAKFEHKINLNIVRCCQLIVNDSRSSKNLKKSIRKLGPVSGSVSVEQPSFQFAKEGIYYEEKCEKVANHDVLVVGYGTDNKGHNYWIVKNSFGISWGDNGFLKISARATKDKCRILNRYMFPKFKDQRPDLIIFL